MKLHIFTLALAAAALASASVHAESTTQTLPSGVKIEHTKVGTGAKPKATDTVTVHYEGKLDDGTVFDSSYKRGQPIGFPLNRVIPCWTEGMQQIAVGGEATLTCPSETAYGSRGAGGVIPPNANLTFRVELIDIK